jgi:hypothetical protein
MHPVGAAPASVCGHDSIKTVRDISGCQDCDSIGRVLIWAAHRGDPVPTIRPGASFSLYDDRSFSSVLRGLNRARGSMTNATMKMEGFE